MHGILEDRFANQDVGSPQVLSPQRQKCTYFDLSLDKRPCKGYPDIEPEPSARPYPFRDDAIFSTRFLLQSPGAITAVGVQVAVPSGTLLRIGSIHHHKGQREGFCQHTWKNLCPPRFINHIREKECLHRNQTVCPTRNYAIVPLCRDGSLRTIRSCKHRFRQ